MSNAENRACLQDLQATDPRDDKDRIEQDKGGLFGDSYHWILEKLRLPTMAERPAEPSAMDQGRSRQRQDDVALRNH
jgi:hypothetical protein